MASGALTEFLDDRERVLRAVSAACRVPPGSSEWNRGVFSLPDCPAALRAKFSASLSDTPEADERMFLCHPERMCNADPFHGDATGHSMWFMNRWASLTAHSPSQAPEFREPMYIPAWVDEFDGNRGWEETLGKANGFGARGGAITRPSGKWVFDYVVHPDGWELLNLAHDRAHDRAMGLIRSGELGKSCLDPGGLKRLFAEECCLVALAVLVKSDPCVLGNANVCVCCSDDIVKPDGWIPVDSLPCPPPRCFVFASYRVEPPPKAAVSGESKWLEVNRWCCAPTTVAFYGFSCWDVVSKCPFVKRGRRTFIHVPVRAMHSMDLLDGYFECGRRGVLYPALVDDCKPDRECPWPCRMCMDLNRKSVPVFSELQADDVMKAAFVAVDRASEWHEKRRYGRTASDVRKARRSSRSKWAKEARKAISRRNAEERARKWLDRGDPGKCAEILRRVRQGQ